MERVITKREELAGQSKVNILLRRQYSKLLTTTVMLSILFIALIALGVVGFYKGWFGEPGKIYFSPEKTFIICDNEDNQCPAGMECKETMIMYEDKTINTHLCIMIE